MKKISLIYRISITGIILFALFSLKGFTQCFNSNFSNGDFTGWVGSYGQNSSGVYTSITPLILAGTPNSDAHDMGQHTIMNQPGTDFNTGNLLSVLPPGGASCCRLGNDWVQECDASAPMAARLEFTMGVTTTNCIFTYQYAVVLQDPGHASTDQPKFNIYVLDSAGNVVDPICGVYEVYAGSEPGYLSAAAEPQACEANTVLWKDWTTVGIDLSLYIGSDVKIQFTTYDCALTGHFGYAYIACYCGTLQLAQQCLGDSSIVTAPSGFANYLWTPGGFTTQTAIYPIPPYNNGDTVRCTATSVAGCPVNLYTVLSVDTPSFSLSADTICIGLSTTLTATGDIDNTYYWSTGELGTSISVTPATTTTYTVTAISAGGCSDVKQTIVTVSTALNISLASNPSSCGYPDGSATATVSGGSGTYTYTWSSGTPPFSATLINLVPGTYTVTVNDGGGCSGIESIVVTGTPAVNTSMAHTDVTCYGFSDGTATVTPSDGTPPFTYSWSNFQTSQTATGLSALTYCVTVTDFIGCTSSACVSILQPASPLSSSITVINVACFNQPTGSANLTVMGGTGWPDYDYYWSPGGSTSQDLSGVMAGMYIVTITDANLCTLVDTAIITQPATPVCVTITSQNLICHDVCEGLVVATGCGGTPGLGGYTYNWDTLGIVNDSLIDVCAGTFYVTVTDGAGCTVVGGAIVDQPPEPAPLILIAVDVLCYGDTTGMVELNYADILPTNSYQWSTGDTTQDIEWLPAGWYQVTVTTIDSCVRVANITVNQPADPLSGSFNITDVQCYNDSNGVIDLTVNGGTSGYTYYWSPQIGGNNPTTEDLTDLFLGTDSMTYYVTITDANGCITYDSATIHQPQAVLNAVITGGNINCYGDETGWASIYPAGGTQPWTYLWSDSTLTDSLYDIPAGLYSVTVTDAHGCDTVYTITLTQPIALNISLVPVNENCPDYCDGSILSDMSGGTPGYSGYTYLWNTVPPQTTVDAVLLCDGTYGVTVTDSLGCMIEDMATITTSWQVNADAIAYPTSGYFILPVNFTFTGSGANSYLWDFGDGTPPSTDQDPFHEFAASGTYTVTLIAYSDTPYFCQDTFYLTIEVLTPSSLIVPNVFTPNGDLINDEFYFDYEAIAEFHCVIFNRWGKLIYEWDDISHGWDGITTDGKQASDGVYFYILSAKGYDDIEYEMHGTVTLIK